MRDLAESGDDVVPHRTHDLGVLFHIRICVGKRSCHRGYSRYVLRSGALSSFLSSALDQITDLDTLFDIQEARALRAMIFVGGRRKHIDVVGNNIYRYVGYRLDGIRVEEHALFSADSAYLPYRLYRSDLVVRRHYSNEARIISDRLRDLLSGHDALLAYIQQRYIEPLFFQLRQRMKDRMVFERRRDHVHLPFFFSYCSSGEERLVVSLASARSEDDLARFCVYHLRHSGSCFIEHIFRPLSEGVKARRVSVCFIHMKCHCVYGSFAHFSCRSIISINHFVFSFHAFLSCIV